MGILDRVDPGMRPLLEETLAAFPGGLNAIADLTQRRMIASAVVGAMTQGLPVFDAVTWEDQTIPTADGTAGFRVRVYRPRADPQVSAGILFFHSGGMILGDLEFEHAAASRLSAEVGAVVVSVEYRLAPENPYPAPVDDAVTALRWLLEGSSRLGIQDGRFAIYGTSAGGGLALATALRARDELLPKPRLVVAIYPMIDDRIETASSREITGLGVWDAEHNREGWSLYLGGGEADTYAAPARATDLTGLAPVFLEAAELDVFRDENIVFAQRLMADGVPTELHVYPGAFHGYEAVAPDHEMSRKAVSARYAALRRALHPN